MMEVEDSVCKDCGNSYKNKKSLAVHRRRSHQNILKTKICHFVCDSCGYTFSLKSNLNRHRKLFHDFPKSGRKSRLLCPLKACDKAFPNYCSLRNHITESHNIDITCEDHHFNSVAEFGEWKTKTEQETVTKYTLDSKGKLLNSGKKYYFNCHRSHNYTKKGKNLRALKLMGSNKINKACPSRMEVLYLADGSCVVKFWKLHLGHMSELGRCYLDDGFRREIPESLSTYKCSCTDFLMKLNICKHIYGIHKLYMSKSDMCRPNYYDNEEGEKERKEEIAELIAMKHEIVKEKSEKEKIISQCNIIIDLSDGLSAIDAEILSKKLEKIITSFNKKEITHLQSTEKVNPVKQKIDKQLRFFSRKKINRSTDKQKLPLKKPSTFEATINIHSSFDHSYAGTE